MAVQNDDAPKALVQQAMPNLFDGVGKRLRGYRDGAPEVGQDLRVAERDSRQQKGVQPFGHSLGNDLCLHRVRLQRQMRAVTLGRPNRQDRNVQSAALQLRGGAVRV